MTARESAKDTVALNRLVWRWAFVLVVLGVFAVWATWRMTTAATRLPQLAGAAPAAEAPPPAAEAKMWYRCTMPECGDVGSDDPDSRCPVCGMKREPVGMVGPQDAGELQITLGERARRLAALETEPVQHRFLFKCIRTVGRIVYDETRHKVVSAWTGGRIDRLFADFTGMRVSQGDHLVEIYSPELLSAQEEYLQAVRSAESMRDSGIEASRRSAEQLRRSARRKLELLGITETQIAALEDSAAPQTHLVVYAPLGGTIVAKRAMEGMYVKTGDVLYEIADLTHVWLLLDVYEADLPWIQPFQDVLVTAEALPGEQFQGRIVFVDPVVTKLTRTVAVRVNVANPQRRLKPDLFVTAEIAVLMGADGRAVAPRPDGAYACPMHPWETSATEASCPICEMPLVPIASLPGYTPPGEPQPVLSVPRAAILQTGERSLAYVEVAPGTYRGAQVDVGPLARAEDGGEYYPVLTGLAPGQSVVTRGNFAIDSQMQLAGKPSLFQPHGFGAHSHEPAPPAAPEGDEQPQAVQTLCPVMGNPIDQNVFLDFHGVRICFCCLPCVEKFKAQPEKYIPKLPAGVQAAIHHAITQEKPTDD